MSLHPDPEVLVVGAGPVGLVAAVFLQKLGVRVSIVDMHQRTTQHSYALAIHPGTLDVLEEAGLSDQLLAAGRKVKTLSFYEDRARRAAVDYSTLSSKHPYLLVVRQSALERATEDALRRQGVTVRWAHRLEALDSGVPLSATVATLDQVATGYPVARTESLVVRSETVHPVYVIGADGYDSSVRRMSGIEMDTYGGGQMFSVYEIEADGDLPDDGRVMFDPETTSVYWPLEKGRCRFGFEIASETEHSASMDRLQELMADRAPWCTARPTTVYWSTLALFDRRVARSFGGGGVSLAGDAAHQAGPVGVHSMNAGLHEARELATRMAAILRAGGEPTSLDEYAAGTREQWHQRAAGHAPVHALPETDPWVRQHAARIADCIPASGPDLPVLLSQLRLRAERSGEVAPTRSHL